MQPYGPRTNASKKTAGGDLRGREDCEYNVHLRRKQRPIMRTAARQQAALQARRDVADVQ